MKSTINRFYSLGLFVLISCSNSNVEKSNKENLTKDKVANTAPGQAHEETGIIGEWEQQYTCFDKNANYKLEAEEKKPSGTRLGFDWFKFNADGTCLRDKEVKFNSSYEIQVKNSSKELLIHNVHAYTIVELTDKELILGAQGVFMVFKKIN